jgi:hypothetical protein
MCGGSGGGGPFNTGVVVAVVDVGLGANEPGATIVGRSRGESRLAWRLPQLGERSRSWRGGSLSRDENDERAVLGEWTSGGVDGRELLIAISSMMVVAREDDRKRTPNSRWALSLSTQPAAR